jgi:hypothetical protein
MNNVADVTSNLHLKNVRSTFPFKYLMAMITNSRDGIKVYR